MKHMFRLAVAASLVVAAMAQTPAPPPNPTALVNQYCVGCHSARLKTGGVVLEGLDFTHPAVSGETLEKVLRKVRTGEMPPAGMPHPQPATATAFANLIQAELDKSAAASPNPGRAGMHRLNRAEYSNTIRDLLALDTKPGALLPVDDSGYGFDNIADVLSISPALLERYMSVARRISRLAVGDPAMKPTEDEFTVESPGKNNSNVRVSDDLPFDSSGGAAIPYYFPLDAEYLIRAKLNGGANKDYRLPVKAGLHIVGVTFLRQDTKPEIVPGAGRRGGGGAAAAAAANAAGGGGRGAAMPARQSELDLRLDGVKLKRFEAGGGQPKLDKISISGPFNATGAGDTPSRERIFTCHPVTAQEETPCAHTIVAAIARRAFRRNVTEADVKPLMAFYESGRAQGSFDHGIEESLRAILVSPDFLFRIERDPKGAAPNTNYRIADVELASRLSYFLWSSMPDDRLLDLATQGKLKDPAVLQAEVTRMLDDPRSDALTANFAGQWLYLRNLQIAKPDPDVFPEFDESLRAAFRQETELFFQGLVRDDRSLLELLDANYTYLNQRLAEHYGIPGIYGSQFRKVQLTDPNRGGLLGQGSILTVTSYPNRTSVVQRGKWILENLLGAPPPPPPPDIPDLKPHGADGRLLTLREQMENHRANPVCASCHVRMDPLGFALENYDGVGKWRDKDSGNQIDPSGKLPDGSNFVGPAGLKKILLTTRREQFVDTATEKLLLYALGRGLEYYDMPVVRAIGRDAAKQDYRMRALVSSIVKSAPFQMRRAADNDVHH